jgi:hypothetical protein
LEAVEVSNMRLLLREKGAAEKRERGGPIINLSEKRIVIATLKCRILNIGATARLGLKGYVGGWRRVGLGFSSGVESGCEVTAGRKKEVAVTCFLQTCLRKIK